MITLELPSAGKGKFVKRFSEKANFWTFSWCFLSEIPAVLFTLVQNNRKGPTFYRKTTFQEPWFYVSPGNSDVKAKIKEIFKFRENWQSALLRMRTLHSSVLRNKIEIQMLPGALFWRDVEVSSAHYPWCESRKEMVWLMQLLEKIITLSKTNKSQSNNERRAGELKSCWKFMSNVNTSWRL